MFLGTLLILGLSQLAIALANWLTTRIVTLHPLPRINFFKGILEESSALIIVSTMLTGIGNFEHLMNALEVGFLANRDNNLLFGLLTDSRDADTESLPGDELLLSLVQEKEPSYYCIILSFSICSTGQATVFQGMFIFGGLLNLVIFLSTTQTSFSVS